MFSVGKVLLSLGKSLQTFYLETFWTGRMGQAWKRERECRLTQEFVRKELQWRKSEKEKVGTNKKQFGKGGFEGKKQEKMK